MDSTTVEEWEDYGCGEYFDKSGVIVALAEERKHKMSGMPLNEWCVVAYGKYGEDVLRVFPITQATGDKAAVDKFRRECITGYGDSDKGTREANYAARVKFFTRVMPSKDFISWTKE